MKRFVKKLDNLSDDEAQEFLEEDYVAALGICAQGIGWENLTQLLLQEILLVLKTCTMLMKLFLKALSSRYAGGNK